MIMLLKNDAKDILFGTAALIILIVVPCRIENIQYIDFLYLYSTNDMLL